VEIDIPCSLRLRTAIGLFQNRYASMSAVSGVSRVDSAPSTNLRIRHYKVSKLLQIYTFAPIRVGENRLSPPPPLPLPVGLVYRGIDTKWDYVNYSRTNIQSRWRPGGLTSKSLPVSDRNGNDVYLLQNDT